MARAKTLRALSGEEIEFLASRQGVRRVGVENFLGTIEGLTQTQATANLETDARSYGWTLPTTSAIRQGISLAADALTLQDLAGLASAATTTTTEPEEAATDDGTTPGIQPPQTVHRPELRAVDTGREFDPRTEAHHFGFVVKAIDPGCTLEIQIEERSGRVTRLTTTDDPQADARCVSQAIAEAAERFIQEWSV